MQIHAHYYLHAHSQNHIKSKPNLYIHQEEVVVFLLSIGRGLNESLNESFDLIRWGLTSWYPRVLDTFLLNNTRFNAINARWHRDKSTSSLSLLKYARLGQSFLRMRQYSPFSLWLGPDFLAPPANPESRATQCKADCIELLVLIHT